eukprot:240810_1
MVQTYKKSFEDNVDKCVAAKITNDNWWNGITVDCRDVTPNGKCGETTKYSSFIYIDDDYQDSIPVGGHNTFWGSNYLTIVTHELAHVCGQGEHHAYSLGLKAFRWGAWKFGNGWITKDGKCID